MVRKAFLAFAVFAVLSVFGGVADGAVVLDNFGGAVPASIPPRCC